MKSKSAEKIRLTSYDELFGTEENNVEGTYTKVPLSQLHSFKNHPFKVLDDEKMQETVESVKQHGLIQPGIVRPCADGYEVVAGHRRWRACEIAGETEMPVIIRELDDDAATVLMVDTNIQRENLLPSEKARAYKMKYEALKHQGSKGDKHTADAVGEKAGDSGRTVQRYIRLASLIDELLELVDTGRIAMIAGERLSFLNPEEQEMVLGAAENIGVYPSPAQAGQIKAMSEEGTLSEGSVYALLVKKENGGQSVTISSKKIRDYFPPAYTKTQIEEVIYSLLEQWKQGKEGKQMQEIQFDYFRGMEAEQYSFYRVPKVLFTAECFKSLSCEAKVLYGLMLDRMSLSIKNRWFDEEDRVYIIFTVEEIMELLGCGRQKAIKNIAELDSEKGIGLIEKKRLGLGKPNVIYVKNFMIKDCPEPKEGEKVAKNAENTQKYENQTSRSMKNGFQEVPESDFQKYENQTSGSMKTELQEVPKSDFKKCENRTSGSMEIKLQEVPKSNCNNTDINNTDFSETDLIQSYPSSAVGEVRPSGEDMMERMESYREIIRENISYPCFVDKQEREDVDELIELMVEILMRPDDSVVRIGGTDKPVSVVKSRFLKLNYSHIEYVLFSLNRNTSKVSNIRAYLLTTLYNSSMTMKHYFQAEVNHDLYGGG